MKASPVAKRLARENQIDIAQISGTGPSSRIVRRDVEAYMESAKAAPVAPTAQPAARHSPTCPGTTGRTGGTTCPGAARHREAGRAARTAHPHSPDDRTSPRTKQGTHPPLLCDDTDRYGRADGPAQATQRQR